MRLVLLGPPGAGKGTQGVMPRERYGIPQIYREILRDHVQRGTKLGISARSYMDRGEYVPDDIVVSMVMDRLADPDADKGFILDGFPSTVSQAEALERALDAAGDPLTAVLKFSIGGEVAASPGRTFHVPQLRAHVPRGAQTAGRRGRVRRLRRPAGEAGDDDEPPLDAGSPSTGSRPPLERFYAERDLLHQVDAETTPDEVIERSMDILERVG